MKSPRRAGVLRNRENRKNEIKRRSEKSAGAVFCKERERHGGAALCSGGRGGKGAYDSFGTICACSLKFNF